MPKQQNKIVGEVSDTHMNNFKLIKGAVGADNNGQALEELIDIATPIIKKRIISKK